MQLIQTNKTSIQTNKTTRWQACQRGFTLLELLVVITLLGVISTITILAYDNVPEESRENITKYEMQALKTALLQFRSHNRAFPCGVYNLNERPYELDEVNMIYTNLPAAPATPLHKKAWCDGNGRTENNALQMLLKFPFDIGNPASYTVDREMRHPLWNQDTKLGWRGPYIANIEGIRDAWGNYYRLLDPELDFTAYDRNNLWCALNDVVNEPVSYVCQDVKLTPAHKPGNSARIVSNGPDGIYGGPNTTNPNPANPDQCLPNLNDDDLVLCLLK